MTDYEALADAVDLERKRRRENPEQYRPDPKREPRRMATKAEWRVIHDHFEGASCFCGLAYDHLHHVLPRARGGADTIDNILAVCRGCHDDIHAHKPDVLERVRRALTLQHLDYLNGRLDGRGMDFIRRTYPFASRSVYATCPECGSRMAAKAFRCKACSPLGRGERNYQWKGDAANHTTKRQRPQNKPMAPGTACGECGEPARDRHHIDGDPGNNAPENIAVLCRRCHMQADGRLDRLKALVAQIRRAPAKSGPCADCGRPSKPMVKGRCRSCYHRTLREKAKGAA